MLKLKEAHLPTIVPRFFDDVPILAGFEKDLSFKLSWIFRQCPLVGPCSGTTMCRPATRQQPLLISLFDLSP